MCLSFTIGQCGEIYITSLQYSRPPLISTTRILLIQCDTKLLIINLTWFKRKYLNQFGTKTRHIKNKNKVLIRGKHQIHFYPFFTSLLPWIFNPKRLQPTLRHNAKPYYIIGTKVYVLQKKYILSPWFPSQLSITIFESWKKLGP